MTNKSLKHSQKTSLLLLVIFLQSCSSTMNNFPLEVDSLDSFNIANYNEFSLNMNKSNLSAEVNPIRFQKLESALTAAIVDRGLTLNSEANLNIELIIEPKEKLRLEDDFLLRGSYGYNTRRLIDIDRLETIDQFILRVNVKDLEANKIVWTGLKKWRKGSSKDPLADEYLQFIVDNILQSI